MLKEIRPAPSTEPSGGAWNPRVKAIGAAAVLAGLVLVVYAPALNGGFVWDDDSWTTKIAGSLRDLTGLGAIWFRASTTQQYYPLTATTFWLDYHLWRFWPLPYHVENVLLHATAAILFWRLLRRLAVRGAWLAAALFALHPVMVESAAWITERKNVLSLTLCLAAFLAYLRAARKLEPTEEAEPGATGRLWPSYGVALSLFVGALLAKTMVCSLPAAILLVTWWKRGRLRWRQDLLPTLPFFAVAIGLCTTTLWLEQTQVGARGPEYALTLAQRVLIAGRAFWFYLGKLFWPANLSFIYPRWQPNAAQVWQWVYPVTAVGVLVGAWVARRRIGRGPFAALAIFTGTLAPTLGFVNVYFMRYSFVCDHWAYLPSLPIVALVASGLARLGASFAPKSVLKPAFSAALLLVLGILTWRQAGMYADLESLWRNTIARNPDSWVAYTNLGNALFRRGEAEEAMRNFREAIRIKPDLPEVYTSLGSVLGSKGQLDEAVDNFRHAIRLKPDYAEAHYDLGVALEQEGELAESIAHLRQAVRLKPDFMPARHRLDRLLRQIARYRPDLVQSRSPQDQP